MDAPSVSQGKDCLVKLRANLSMLPPTHHGEVEVGLEEDVLF